MNSFLLDVCCRVANATVERMVADATSGINRAFALVLFENGGVAGTPFDAEAHSRASDANRAILIARPPGRPTNLNSGVSLEAEVARNLYGIGAVSRTELLINFI